MSNLEANPLAEGETPRSKGPNPWIILLIAIAFAGFYLMVTLPRGGSDTGTHPAIGRALTDLQLQPLVNADASVTLEELSGEVVLLNFWGTWCPPCRLEYPHLATLAGRLSDKNDFRLLSVSVDGAREDNLEELRQETATFLEQQDSRLPTYADLHAFTRQHLAIVLGEDVGYPLTVILDRQGIIRGVWLGYADGITEEMHRLIKRLLDEKPSQAADGQAGVGTGEHRAADRDAP